MGLRGIRRLSKRKRPLLQGWNQESTHAEEIKIKKKKTTTTTTITRRKSPTLERNSPQNMNQKRLLNHF